MNSTHEGDKHSKSILADIARPPQSSDRRQARLLLFVLVVLAVLIGVPVYFLLPDRSTPVLTRYATAAAELRTLRETVTASGHIEAAHRTDVVSMSAGVVAQVLVEEGAVVKAGDVLFSLASLQTDEKLSSAAQALARAQMDLRTLELDISLDQRKMAKQLAAAAAKRKKLEGEYAMALDLMAAGAIGVQELATARAAVEEAQQDEADLLFEQEITAAKDAMRLQAARAAVADCTLSLEQAEREKDALQVKAPISGKVVAIKTKLNSPVAAHAVLAEIAAVDHLVVQVDVPAVHAHKVKPGQTATVRVGDSNLAAEVSQLAAQAVNSSDGAVVRVQLKLKGDLAAVVLNAPASAEIQTGQRERVLCLPRGAYFASGEAKYVYVVADGRAHKRQVAYGVVDGNYIEVRSGLSAGEQVIVSSYDGFLDHDTVELSRTGG